MALHEIAERLAGESRVSACPATVWRFIELAFSKRKALLRKAAARSLEDFEQAIAETIDQFLPQVCANFFKHDGYGHG